MNSGENSRAATALGTDKIQVQSEGTEIVRSRPPGIGAV